MRTASSFGESRSLRWAGQIFSRVSFLDFLSSSALLRVSQWLLCLLLFTCLFFPRISFGTVASYYRIDLRVEDLLLGLLVILFLVRAGRHQADAAISEEEKVFLWFLIAAQLSILSGLFFRTIDKPVISLLYLVKWFGYFAVFFVTSRLGRGRAESLFFEKAFFFLGMAVAAYGYWEYFFPASKAVYPNYYRLYERPPFHGDANHVGGLLTIWMGFFLGNFLKAQKKRDQAVLFSSLLFVFFPFIWTYSRKSYLALAGLLAAGWLLAGERKRTLLAACILLIVGLLFPTRLSERLAELQETFVSLDPFHSSWAGNLDVWKRALWNFEQFFLFGSGFGSRHRLFYESQYVMILAETGLVGTGAFLMLCLKLIRGVGSFLTRAMDSKRQGWAVGWLLGFTGLLIHSGSCVSWTVSKIAVPFWFLTGFVLTSLGGRQDE